ncbi:MAG TPA: hypothetical protein VF943_02850 [Burkholderiales bacterium]
MKGMEFLQWLENKWDSRFAAVLLPAVTLVSTFLTLLKLGAELHSAILVSVLAASFVAGLWWYTHRPPRVRDDYLGILVAVTAEGERERSRVSADFVAAVQELFAENPGIAKVDVVELPRYHATQITNPEIATKYLGVCRAHFATYGRASIRKVQGQEHFVLKLQGVVVHTPIEMDASTALAKEMVQVLPLKVRISCENDLNGFEVTSKCFTDGTKFVIASAALLSGDFDLAEQLLLTLRQQFSALKKLKRMPGIKALIEKIPPRLADVYFCQSMRYHNQWRMTHAPEDLDKAKDYGLRLRKLAPEVETPYLALAIWHFARNRDLASAFAELAVCEKKRMRSPIWRFSVAFLHAYSGDLDRAFPYYQAALRMMARHELPFEVEEFMEWVLQIEPNKIQLYFCLGLINLFGKDDSESARADFQKFIDAAQNVPAFSASAARARQYVTEIAVVSENKSGGATVFTI